jgi:hypothetical protein
MNYSKFLSKSSNQSQKFKFISQDEKIKISMEILKDIGKTKILINNYSRIGNKLIICSILRL